MNIKVLLILLPPALAAKCHCYDKPEVEKKPAIPTVVIQAAKPAPEPLPGIAKPIPPSLPTQATTGQQLVDADKVSIPDPDEPATMKAQMIRAGVMCAAAVAVLFLVRNQLNLKPLVQATENLH